MLWRNGKLYMTTEFSLKISARAGIIFRYNELNL